ncbi:SRPBCC domain-containing protein [Neolewinella antarctica]|uniref:Uncharacterized protein YndB with AHSA1/START domain n=1 Tax=Neolewinella antarctica TaxID=442734 RepID=A0ABX0XGH1_9BACT|nr:SRPBCC domain-containing protein [Neolewinella antarctica]NJC27842.1 uncharacterized protein YndB with AHSA1/START domain [Neolewinella antarctica]
MENKQLTVTTTVPVTPKKAWSYYTEAEHVINWNFASEDWHCPKAINDLRVGGDFIITMAAKDGSMTFDMEGTYDKVDSPEHLAYTLTDKRKVAVDFKGGGSETEVTITFDPADKQSDEQQTHGWEGIANNFKAYVTKMEGGK